ATARRAIRGQMVFTTSFGIEAQAIVDAIFSQDLDIKVVTLDTGRLFPETYDVWAETERRYGRLIHAFYPDEQTFEARVARQGVNGFRVSVDARRACCDVRKVEPLRRALAGAAGWITGLRADQSAARAGVAFAAFDEAFRLVKINPISDWTRERVVEYVRERAIPYNPLHDRGFLSIGCAPCTRAVAPGEPERAGRWWWERDGTKECGLHVQRAASNRNTARARAVPTRASGT